jgi:hypothetical protein
LPKLTVDQVNSAVRKHLKIDGMKVAIVARDAAGLRELLTSGKPTPIAYDTEGTPEDVLAEDKQIAAFPLRDVTVRIVPVEQMFVVSDKGQVANEHGLISTAVYAEGARAKQSPAPPGGK